MNGTVRACIKICDYTCKDCGGPDANECTECAANRVLSNGVCLCPNGTYAQSGKDAKCLGKFNYK